MNLLYRSYAVIVVALVLSMNLGGMQTKAARMFKANGMQTKALRMLRAKDFLAKVTKENALTYDNVDLVKYLQERVKNSSAKGGKRIEEVYVTLNSNINLQLANDLSISLQLDGILDASVIARVMYFFSAMVGENTAFELCRQLGCCPGDLTVKEFLEKVCEKFTKEDCATMKLDESKKAARDILSLLKSTSSNRE